MTTLTVLIASTEGTAVEKYLSDLATELRKRGVFATRFMEETRGHLADAVEAGQRRGVLEATGPQGLLQDQRLAFDHFRRAADLGNWYAQANIGDFYAYGLGVAQNNEQALKWYRSAALQNVPLACGFPFTGNLGSAHIYGGEVELDAVMAPGLMIMVDSGYSHARFVTNPVAATTTMDNRVQDVPDLTASASLAYRYPISDAFGIVGRVDNNYIGSRVDVTSQPNFLPSYDLTNLRAGVEGNHWAAMMFVNNVTNKMALLTNSPAINVNVATYNRTAVSQPMTVGIDLTYHMK